MATQQLVVRIPTDMDQDLRRVARATGRGRSEIVRDALRAYLGPATAATVRPVERIRHLLGALESGVPTLARDHRAHVLESLRRAR